MMMAWGGFMDKNSSDYLRLLAKIERTIQNLEELSKYVSSEKQSLVRQTIEILSDLPGTLQEDRV
jgi:hypothetical protein